MLFELNLAFEASLLVNNSYKNIGHTYDNIQSEIDRHIEK